MILIEIWFWFHLQFCDKVQGSYDKDWCCLRDGESQDKGCMIWHRTGSNSTLNTVLKSSLPDTVFQLSLLSLFPLYLCLLIPGSSTAHLNSSSLEQGSPTSARIYTSPVTRKSNKEQVLQHEALQKHEIRDSVCPKELTSFVHETADEIAGKGRH